MIIIKKTVRDEQIALVRRGNHLKIRSINSFNIVEATRKKKFPFHINLLAQIIP